MIPDSEGHRYGHRFGYHHDRNSLLDECILVARISGERSSWAKRDVGLLKDLEGVVTIRRSLALHWQLKAD